MANKKYQIFISSTYDDLRAERQAAVEAILKAGHIPAGMELFAAGDESQMETIRRWIESSDIYMLILGGRYGSIEPKTGLSYIELEYDYAMSLNKPVFAVVLREESLSLKVKSVGIFVREADHPEKYERFRKKVLSKICAFFDDCKDVKLSIHESIPDIQRRHKLTGWVLASDVPDMEEYIAEMTRLSEENDKLRKENNTLQRRSQKVPDHSSKKESYAELIEVLKNIEIESALFDDAGKTPTKHSLLDVLYASKDNLVVGVTNQVGMSRGQQLLYYEVLPKLEIHGLAETEKVAGVKWRRYKLTKEGLSFLSYIEKNHIFSPKAENTKSKTPRPKTSS